MIEVDGLTKIYNSLRAVDDLSFRVEPGEVLGLVGPNGAGKTTTLRCIAGIIPPTRGYIRINEYLLLKNPLEAKQNIGFVPDEPRLFDHLTVKEHLQFTAAVYGVKDHETKAGSLLEELDLRGVDDSLPDQLSRGMKQKVAIACGLLHSPANLILDEPLTGLDPMGIRRVKEIILSRARIGVTIIVSSHLLPMVEEICSRILIMQKGKKIAHGSLQEISRNRMQFESNLNLEEIFIRVTDGSMP